MSPKKTGNSFFVRSLLVFSCLIFCSSLFSQKNQDSLKKHNRLIIPVMFKTPEMGLAAGLSGSYTFKTTHASDTSIRTSIIQGIGFFTTHKQNIQAFDAAIYFPKENYRCIFL